MKKNLILGCDCDGIFTCFLSGFAKKLNELHNIDTSWFKPERDTISWDLSTSFKIDKKIVDDTWDYIIKNDSYFWQDLKMVSIENWDYFKENISLNQRIDTYFITNRIDTGDKSCIRQTREWLTYAGWNNPMIIIANENKGEIARMLKADLFVDDSGKNCEDVIKHTEKTKCFLYDYPHNKKYQETERLKRIYSMKEFTDEVLKEMNK